MSPQDIERVQASFKKVVPIVDAAADIFYDRLFTIAPAARPLFPDDMAEQKKKLMTVLGMIVGHLNRLDSISGDIESLSKKHFEDYGAIPAHFPFVWKALNYTLAHGLGKDFTPEDKYSWGVVFHVLAGAMSNHYKG